MKQRASATAAGKKSMRMIVVSKMRMNSASWYYFCQTWQSKVPVSAAAVGTWNDAASSYVEEASVEVDTFRNNHVVEAVLLGAWA